MGEGVLSYFKNFVQANMEANFDTSISLSLIRGLSLFILVIFPDCLSKLTKTRLAGMLVSNFEV